MEKESETRPPVQQVDEGVQEERARAMERARTTRDAAAEKALGELRGAVEKDASLVPPVLGCVRARVTLGEICAAIEERYGRHGSGTDSQSR